MPMQYGNIPGVEKPVSRIVQGTVMINSAEDDGQFALLDGIFQRGCNTFDTAHVYGGGRNERAVGRWVRDRSLRDRVVIIAKGAHHNADRRRVTPFDITSDLHDSLARLGFEYIDLYLLHRDDPTQPVEGIVDVLNEHLAAGRIHAFGASNWTHKRIAEANAYARQNGLTGFVASSPNFSLAQQNAEPWEGCVSISGPSQADARKWYQSAQMPLMSWSSLAGGFFAGQTRNDTLEAFQQSLDGMVRTSYASEENFRRLKRAETLADEKGLTVAQIAAAWVLCSPMNTLPMFGPRSLEEFDQNLAALDVVLSDAERDWLDLRSDQR